MWEPVSKTKKKNFSQFSLVDDQTAYSLFWEEGFRYMENKEKPTYQGVGSGCVPQNGNKNVWNRQKHDFYFQEHKVNNFKII